MNGENNGKVVLVLNPTSARNMSNAICDSTAPNATAAILRSFPRKIIKIPLQQ